MNKKPYLILCCLVASLTLTGIAQTVPPLINYQGKLMKDSTNAIPTADYTLTFIVFDTPAGGQPIWGPQTFDGAGGQGHGPKIPVVQGYFNVMLGPVDTAGRSLVSAFSGPDRYVEVQVGPDVISPRQRILSAPFAFKANIADVAERANTVADGAIANRHLGIVSQLSAADGSPQTSLSVDNAGKIGIGTSNPNATLHIIQQGSDAIIFGKAATDSVQTSMGHGSSVNGEASFISSTKVGNAAFVPMTLWTSDQERLRITVNGNIGIGTAAPSEKLHVDGTVKATSFVGAVPAGTVVAFMAHADKVPAGWLLCDGRRVPQIGNDALYAAIGNTYGPDDGGTITLPDLRGVFLRGLDLSPNTTPPTSGRDPEAGNRTAWTASHTGNKVGSNQSDDFKSHSHPFAGATVPVGGWGPGAGSRPLSTGDPANWGNYTPEGTVNSSGGTETRQKCRGELHHKKLNEVLIANLGLSGSRNL